MRDDPGLRHELLFGAAAIGAYLGLPTRRIYRLAELGHLPVRKLGGVLVSTKSALRAALGAIEPELGPEAPVPAERVS